MNQLTTTNQPAFLTHLRDEANLSLLKEANSFNPKDIQSNVKSTSKDATMKELEAIKRQRIA